MQPSEKAGCVVANRVFSCGIMFIRFVEGVQHSYIPASPKRGVTSVAAASSAGAVSPRSDDAANERGSSGVVKNPYLQAAPSQEERVPAIVVRQIMSSSVITLSSGLPLSAAEDLFAQRRFRHIPIVDSDGKPEGIVSDRDILRIRAAIKQGAHERRVVGEIMSKNVLTVTPDTPIRDAARVLIEEHIGCLPVVDSNNRIVGMVTRSDILRTLMKNVPLKLWI